MPCCQGMEVEHATNRTGLERGEGRGLAQGVFGLELALSPDGSRIVYVGVAPTGGTQLWQRALDNLEPSLVPGTEGATHPVLSPDGLWGAFAPEGGTVASAWGVGADRRGRIPDPGWTPAALECLQGTAEPTQWFCRWSSPPPTPAGTPPLRSP